MNRLKQFKQDHPIACYLLIGKILVIAGSVFQMWITLTPLFSFTMKTLIIILYNVVLLPVGYWLTYCFGEKK